MYMVKGLLLKLLFHPASFQELVITALVSAVVFLWVYGKTGMWMDVPRAGLVSSLAAGILGLALYTGVAALVLIYAGPHLSDSMEQRIPVALGIGVSVLLTVPLIGLIQQSRYLTSLFNWVAGVAVFLLAGFLVGQVFDALGHGQKALDKEKQRQEQWQEF